MTVEILRFREGYVKQQKIILQNGALVLVVPHCSKPMHEMSKEELNICLKCFNISARRKDGAYHKSSSMKSIRAFSDRFLRWPPRNKPSSTISDPAFTETL